MTAYAAMIASLYVLFTYLSSVLGLASGMIQLRLSEALTVLPAISPPPGQKSGGKAAIVGLTLGCVIANLLTGCAPWDVLFGSLATLLGALGTYALRRYTALLWLPPVISNILIVPYILTNVYGASDAHFVLCITVGVGELFSAGVLGMTLYFLLKNRFIKGNKGKRHDL